ncbi:MAG: hypothetical protein Q9173_004321 [Seirophora scorigena]
MAQTEKRGRGSGSRSLTSDLSEKTGEEVQDLMLANLTVEDSGKHNPHGAKKARKESEGQSTAASSICRSSDAATVTTSEERLRDRVSSTCQSSDTASDTTGDEKISRSRKASLRQCTTPAMKRDGADMAADEAAEEDSYLDTAVGMLLTIVNDAQEDIRNLRDAVRGATNDVEAQKLWKEEINDRLDDHADRVQSLETEASMSKERWMTLAEGFVAHKRNSKTRRATANELWQQTEDRVTALEASLQSEKSLRQVAEEKIAAWESEAKRAKERTTYQNQ